MLRAIEKVLQIEVFNFENIVVDRERNIGEYYIDYLIGFYKKFEVRLIIGNAGYDEYIYVSLSLVAK